MLISSPSFDWTSFKIAYHTIHALGVLVAAMGVLCARKSHPLIGVFIGGSATLLGIWILAPIVWPMVLMAMLRQLPGAHGTYYFFLKLLYGATLLAVGLWVLCAGYRRVKNDERARVTER